MNISFDITHTSDDFDLRAGDFDSRAAFESEVREFLDLIEQGKPLVISLLPPFTSGFAAKGAFDVIFDVLSETESDREVRLLVRSKRVADTLRRTANRASLNAPG